MENKKNKDKKDKDYIWLSLDDLKKQPWREDILLTSLYALNPPFEKTLCIELSTNKVYCFKEADLLKACGVYEKLMSNYKPTTKGKNKNEK